MHQYPLWKTLTLIVVALFGALYALPNLYGEAPAVQIATSSGDPVPSDLGAQVAKALEAGHIAATASRAEKGGQWVVLFSDPETQLKAEDVLQRELGSAYVASLNLASTTPSWLGKLGARPMPLGLDLRGEGNRFRARERIAGLVGPWIAARPLAEVAARFDQAGVCWSRYQTVAELAAGAAVDPAANPMFAQLEQAGIGRYAMPATPLDFSASGRLPPAPAPRLGEHTEEVLCGLLGLGSAEFGRLHDQGVVATAE